MYKIVGPSCPIFPRVDFTLIIQSESFALHVVLNPIDRPFEDIAFWTHRGRSAVLEDSKTIDDVIGLTFQHEHHRRVPRRRIRAEHEEGVGQVGRGHAQMSPKSFSAPRPVFQRIPISGERPHRGRLIESSGLDDKVDFMKIAILSYDSVRCDFFDAARDKFDVRPSKSLSVILAVRGAFSTKSRSLGNQLGNFGNNTPHFPLCQPREDAPKRRGRPQGAMMKQLVIDELRESKRLLNQRESRENPLKPFRDSEVPFDGRPSRGSLKH